MAESSLFFLTYWVNLFLSIFTRFYLIFRDFFGFYNPPSSDPVSVSGNGGLWQGPFETPIIGAAAANLPDGRILIWSAYERAIFSQPDFSDNGKTRTAILDPVAMTATEELVVDTKHDMFCPGTAYLTDHTIMVTGGTSSTRTSIFNVDTETWSQSDEMILGRGYHSMTLLGDGSVFTLGGSFTGGIGDKYGELWTPDDRKWTLLPDVEAEGSVVTDDVYGVQTGDNHMWLFTAPNSERIFHAGPSKAAHWIDVTGSGNVIRSIERGNKNQMCGSAVMYDIGKILVLGGAENQDSGDAHRAAYTYDINNGEEATVERVGDMTHRRIFCNAVVLPDGDVIVAGGQTRSRKFTDDGGVLQAELWSPSTKQFTPLESMQVVRTYHSTCILTKDAKVACMGGGLCSDADIFGCNNHYDFEVFTPPYLLNSDLTPATRPTIVSSPATIAIGELLTVQTDVPCTFAMIRLGAVTHTINNDHRRVPLAIETEVTTTYTVRVPGNEKVALPGLYWLFALDENGVPSEGTNIEVTSN